MCRSPWTALLMALLAACGGGSGGSGGAGPVAVWTFDADTGDTAADVSGHDNHAGLRGAAFAAGRSGHALQMDGGNDGIMVVPLSASLRTTAEAITVMGWAYRTAVHNVALVAHGYPDLFLGFHGLQFKWQVITAGGGGARCYADPKHEAKPGEWFHVAGTYDGHSARLYVNGVEICSKWLWRGGPVRMSEAPFSVSGYLDEQGRIVDEMTGMIDDVRIYPRALDAAEVRDIHAGGR